MCTQITCDFSVTNTVATLYEHCVWSLIPVLACSSSSCLRAFVCFVCSPGYTRCSCHHRILGFLLNISVCLIQRAGSSQRAESVSLPATEIFNKYCQMSVQVISLHLHHSKGALFPSFSRDDKNEKENKTLLRKEYQRVIPLESQSHPWVDGDLKKKKSQCKKHGGILFHLWSY